MRRVLLLALLALSACGSGTPQLQPPVTVQPITDDQSDADDQDDGEGDTVTERTVNITPSPPPQPLLDALSLAAQDVQPLAVTVSVVRARNGKFKGFTRAKVVFVNSGPALTGSVHLDLKPGDGGPVTAPVYDKTSFSILGTAKRTSQTVYSAPLGRQCARVSFSLKDASGQTYEAPADAPVVVCDVDNPGDGIVSEMQMLSVGTTWPGVRQSVEFGTRVAPMNFQWDFWPEFLTPPTIDQVKTRLDGLISNLQYGNYGGNAPRGAIEGQQTGDFAQAVTALTTYGGNCKTAPQPAYVCRVWGAGRVSAEKTHWKRIFKVMNYYNSAGARLYGYSGTAGSKDGFPTAPRVVVMTVTGPLGTLVLSALTSGVHVIDPPYMRSFSP
jgi:predicted small lipoprotein YifL